MELSLEVKGYLSDKIAQIFSWHKISTLALKAGVNPSPIINKTGNFGKRDAALYIISNLPEDREEQLIKVVLEMSQRGTFDSNYQEETFNELNPIVQNTMGYRLEIDGNLIPIFDKSFKLEEQQNFIITKLTDFGFNDTKQHYQDSLRSFSASPKGSMGVLRSCYETLVNNILISKGITPTGNMKDNLQSLETLNILEQIDPTSCQKCGYKKRDNEFNFSYDLFGMLSHYASHQEIITEEIASLLFPSVSSFLRFLLERYEKVT